MEHSPELLAYWRTPEFIAYERAYHENIRLYNELCPRGMDFLSGSGYARLLASQKEMTRLLNVARRTPEHLAAFGWNTGD